MKPTRTRGMTSLYWQSDFKVLLLHLSGCWALSAQSSTDVIRLQVFSHHAPFLRNNLPADISQADSVISDLRVTDHRSVLGQSHRGLLPVPVWNSANHRRCTALDQVWSRIRAESRGHEDHVSAPWWVKHPERFSVSESRLDRHPINLLTQREKTQFSAASFFMN